MNKIIGLLTAWGVERWARSAIEQALEYCDEVLAVVSPYTSEMIPFEDGTYEICKEYKSLKLLDYRTQETTVSRAVADVLNHMLERSTLREVGNWVWILDADEFYAKSAPMMIRDIINVGGYEHIKVESKFFMINMHHYLNETGGRLHKIMTSENHFVPTTRWSRLAKRIYTLPRADGMFHYGLLANAKMYREKWRVEYSDHPDKKQLDKIKWIDEIYPYYDLRDEGRWIEENRRLFGIRSPWFNRGFTPDANGKLFRYSGKHPKFIERTGLVKIEDFRLGYENLMRKKAK